MKPEVDKIYDIQEQLRGYNWDEIPNNFIIFRRRMPSIFSFMSLKGIQEDLIKRHIENDIWY